MEGIVKETAEIDETARVVLQSSDKTASIISIMESYIGRFKV
jgi:hypothetical protein